jgi:hypothetical protein
VKVTANTGADPVAAVLDQVVRTEESVSAQRAKIKPASVSK